MAESRDKETLVAYDDLAVSEEGPRTARHWGEEWSKFEIWEETKGRASVSSEGGLDRTQLRPRPRVDETFGEAPDCLQEQEIMLF